RWHTGGRPPAPATPPAREKGGRCRTTPPRSTGRADTTRPRRPSATALPPSCGPVAGTRLFSRPDHRPPFVVPLAGIGARVGVEIGAGIRRWRAVPASGWLRPLFPPFLPFSLYFFGRASAASTRPPPRYAAKNCSAAA